jgi:hypothetical protein
MRSSSPQPRSTAAAGFRSSGGDPIYQAQGQTSPDGIGFLGAAIVLLIVFGSVVRVAVSRRRTIGTHLDRAGDRQ